MLYRKQITPPFKPIVDSDESVANFDPEFTNSSLSDAGIQPWELATEEVEVRERHSYLGPGGSLSSASNVSKGGMAINANATRPPLGGPSGSPLTSSVQENFRGFTYTGESVLVRSHALLSGAHEQPQSMLADHNMEDSYDAENAVEDEDEEEEDEDDIDEEDGMRTRRQSDVDMD